MAKSKEKRKISPSSENQEREEKDEALDAKKMKNVETIDVKIKTIGGKTEKKTAPIIGYFPSGYDPLKNSNSTGGRPHPKAGVKVYRNVNPRNPGNPRMQVVLGVNGSSVNFVGTNYRGEAATPQLCNYALGVLDKETGILKMVPIASNRIFRLDPKIGGLEEPENEHRDEAEEEEEKGTEEEEREKEEKEREKDDKLKNLTRLYSTKKNITRDVKREALRQTGASGIQKEFDEKLKGIKINTEALEVIGSVTNAFNIPPYNLDANTPETAYLLDKIIFAGDWDYLTDIFDLVEAGLEVSPDVYPSFVCNRVNILKEVKDESKKRTMAGILAYITHLIKFKDRHSMDGVSSAKRHKLPSILSQRFTSMFGTTESKIIPVEKQNLLISYVLVLTLFADDFRSDTSDISKDLRMPFRTLRDHYGYIGCKIMRENQVYLATLPVPLKFETQKRRRK